MLTEKQLENTRKFIGGSKVAGILGLSDYQTPQSIYYEMIYGDTKQETEQMHFGNEIESVIRNELSRRLNVDIITSDETFTHTKHPFLIAHIDGLISGRKEGVEIKNRSVFMKRSYGEEGSDEALPSDVMQCQHYMNVLGLERMHLGVFFGGQELKIYTIERNDALINKMEKALVNFWVNHVEKQIPPAPLTSEEINKFWLPDDDKEVQADFDIVMKASDLEETKEKIKSLELEKEKLENEIKLYMQDNTILIANGEKVATWKTQSSKRFDTAAFKKEHSDLYDAFITESSFRVFRLATFKQKTSLD
jgi:putative phage-type endonuclease